LPLLRLGILDLKITSGAGLAAPPGGPLTNLGEEGPRFNGEEEGFSKEVTKQTKGGKEKE